MDLFQFRFNFIIQQIHNTKGTSGSHCDALANMKCRIFRVCGVSNVSKRMDGRTDTLMDELDVRPLDNIFNICVPGMSRNS